MWLAPHALSLVAFAGAFAVLHVLQTNRSALDLNLGIAGYLTGGAALLASVVFAVRTLGTPERRGDWPWLLAHLAALSLVIFGGLAWLGAHLA
ncbi:MAG: hypothetical protein AAFV49_05800 [Pseudomonadota bacterium]